MGSSIDLRNIGLRLGGAEIFRGLSFEVHPSELLCLLGPSGCGKSTTLRLIGDLLQADGGEVLVGDQAPARAWQQLAYVFQSPRLLPWKDALDNAAFGLEMRRPKMARAERRERAEAQLRRVGLGAHLNKMPAMLSGGERQRVAIARALALDPEIILMDEPFSALDPSTRVSLRQQLVDIWQEFRKTVVFVTHDIDEALFLAERIILLNSRPAVVARTLCVEAARPRDVEHDPDLRAMRADLLRAFGAFDPETTNPEQGVPA